VLVRLVSLSIPFVALVARLAHAEPEDTPCTATLDVHVVDARGHEPLAAAEVRVDGTYAGDTDEAGGFTLRGLCPGSHTLEVQRVDTAAARRTFEAGVTTSLEVELALDPTIGDVIEVEARGPPPAPMRATTAVTGAALERKRGQALTAAVGDVPGVHELESATGVGKPIIRGQFGRRLLLLVDGVRHRAQEWGLDHAPEVDPFIADAITVVRGAGGVRYGPDAIGGAVLVDPPALRFAPGYTGEAHLIGASNGRGGTVAMRLLGATSRLPGLAFQLEGSAKRLAAAESPDYPLHNTGVLDWSAGATAGYERGSVEARLSYRHYQAELGVCACLRIHDADEFFAQLARGAPVDADLYQADFAIDRPKQAVQHDLALARASWEWRDVGTVTARYAFQHDLRREYDVVREATTGAQFNFRLVTHELEALLEHDPIHLSDHWHLRGAAGLVGVAQVHHYAGQTLIPDYTAYGAAAFASERLVGHDWELEAGVRYDLLARTATIERIDFLRLERSGQLALDACGADIDPATCASRFHALTATLGALRRFGDATSARVELSTASRAPDPDEQYLNGAAPTFPVLGLGKPDLSPETTYSASATLAYQGATVTAEASAYANLIDDYIYFSPALDAAGNPIFDVTIRGAFPRFVTRPVDALFYGADGGVAALPHPRLELGAQLSLVRARNLDDDSYLVLVPADRLRGSITVKPPDAAGFRDAFVSIAGTYVARQDRFDLRADLAPPPPAYAVIGAELGATTRIGGHDVKLALQGQNLTNTRHRDYTSLLRYFADAPGWQVWLRASVFFATKGDPR
jgi:iron complex outermembrane receptor protein